MLARRPITILPTMTLAEAIETTRIHRVAGRTSGRTALVTMRPCHAPYHTSRSDVTHPSLHSPCADLLIAVQGYTLPRLVETARDGRLRALKPHVLVASPDHRCCFLPIVLLLMCAWIVLDSSGLPPHGITLALAKVPNGWRDTALRTARHPRHSVR
jgi:hypothetical protein